MSGFRTRSVLKRKHISCCHRNKVTYTIGFAFGPDFDNLSLLDTPDTIWLCREIVEDRATPNKPVCNTPHSLMPPYLWAWYPFLCNALTFFYCLYPSLLIYETLFHASKSWSLITSTIKPCPTTHHLPGVNHTFLGYFWIFKLHIHLLDAVIHLHAVSLEENSLRTGSNSSWNSQYHLLAMCLKQRCCFRHVFNRYWTKNTCHDSHTTVTFYLAW